MLRVPELWVHLGLQLTRVSSYRFKAEVWEYPGPSAWYFIDLPLDIAEEIKVEHRGRARGFGSIRVHVTLGSSQWSTSVFPYAAHGTYILPIKKAVRRAEGIDDGAPVSVVIAIAD